MTGTHVLEVLSEYLGAEKKITSFELSYDASQETFAVRAHIENHRDMDFILTLKDEIYEVAFTNWPPR